MLNTTIPNAKTMYDCTVVNQRLQVLSVLPEVAEIIEKAKDKGNFSVIIYCSAYTANNNWLKINKESMILLGDTLARDYGYSCVSYDNYINISWKNASIVKNKTSLFMIPAKIIICLITILSIGIFILKMLGN